MAVKSLSSVVNGNFISRFANLARQNSGSGSSGSVTLASGLTTAARTYGTAVQGLNGVASYLNVSRGVLEKLDKITDEMISLADHASKGGIGSQKRANLDRQLKDLASEFKGIVTKTKAGGYNALQLEDIESVFVTMGLDPSKVDSIKKIFSFFNEIEDSDEKKSLAADTSHAKRPIKIPSGAYSQEVVTTSGTGTYTKINNLDWGIDSIVKVQALDINGDGRQDLISGDDSGQFAVQLGNGDGTFLAAQTYTNGGSNAGMQIVQLAGDGRYDQVSKSAIQTNVSVSLGGAGGTFGAAVDVVTGMAADVSGITVGDFDGDTISDILVGSNANEFSLMKGNADGTFAAGVTFTTATTATSSLVSGDFDGDGDRDLAVYADQMEIYLNDGSGNFTLDSTFASGIGGGTVEYVDINSDGESDLLVADENLETVTTFLSNSDGTFTQSDVSALGGSAHSISVNDVNNDGIKDIIATGKFEFGVFLGNNDGTFGSEIAHNFQVTGTAITSADFDGDGVIDVISGEGAGVIEYFKGDKIYSSTIQDNVLGKPREFADLFDERRHIKTRPEAYQMLADLKALKDQITENIDASEKVGKFLTDNISVVRAAGFAFLNAASDTRIASISDADQLANEVRAKIRANPGVALAQIGNLEAITVASLVLDSTSFPSLKNYKNLLK